MINNAVLHLLWRELTQNGENERGCMRGEWVIALCVCVWGADRLKMERFSEYTHCVVAHTYFPVQTHVPLHCVLLNVTGVPQTTCPFVLQIMSILICT